jgi:hypothetical protein
VIEMNGGSKMNKRVNLAGISLLTGLLLVSCNFPALLSAQQQDNLETTVPSRTQTLQASPSETVDPEPQPTTQVFTIQLLDQRIFEEGEDPRYEVDGVWPNLEGPETLVTAFNAESDDLIDTIKEDFLSAVTDGQGATEGQGEPPVSYLTFDYDLTYSDQRLFSFLLNFDQYIAMSAHPFPFSHALNYDAQDGSFLQLAQLFLADVDYLDQLGNQIDPILNAKGFGYQVGTGVEVMRERENWNLLAEGLRVNFDVYEVAPYAAGPQFVVIPWEDLADILDPAGPAGNFIVE